MRQASQKPGASKDSPSRLKLKPTPSKDASNMWRKSMTMLSSLTRMGTQQSAAADTAMQPHPDQAAATGLVSQDSSKSVWDQLAHGEGPLTMSIALQHTKSVPLGLEAVQEDEREGQGEGQGQLGTAETTAVLISRWQTTWDGCSSLLEGPITDPLQANCLTPANSNGHLHQLQQLAECCYPRSHSSLWL